MYRFVEFQEFSRQSSIQDQNLLTEGQLKPFRLFFNCVQLAEDSYQGVAPEALGQLQQQLRAASKNDAGFIPNFRAYRAVVADSTQFKKDSLRAEQHRLRKNLSLELQAEPNPLWHTVERLGQGRVEINALLRRLRALHQDKSLYFESFSTSALIKLTELCPDIPVLLNYLQELKRLIKRNYKHTHPEDYRLSLHYLKSIEIKLFTFKESLVENLLDRLGSAHAQKDIYYSDNLYSFIQEANAVLAEENLHLDFPVKPRRDLSSELFERAQHFIYAEGSSAQKQRLNSYSWHSSNEDYEALYANSFSISVIPKALRAWIPSSFNWLYYLFSPAFRYRYNFIKNHAHLIAQQKLLSESKRKSPQFPYNPSRDSDLIKLDLLESKLKHTQQKLNAEVLSESQKFLKGHSKIALVKAYLNHLQQSLRLITLKRMDILAEHIEQLRVYVDMPELSAYSMSRTRELYLSKELKAPLLALYEKISKTLEAMRPDEARTLGNRLSLIKVIMDKFYGAEAVAANERPAAYSLIELVDFSRNLFNVLDSDLSRLKLRLDHYKEGYKVHSLSFDPLIRQSIEHSFYQMIYHYLEFIQAHATESEFPHEKIEAIEDFLLETNPISASCISEIRAHRKDLNTRCRKAKIEFHCRIAMNAIEPHIKRRSFSVPEQARPVIDYTEGPLDLSPACFGFSV